MAIVGSIPTQTLGTDLFDQFSIAVKYINFCVSLVTKANNIPIVMIPISIRSKVMRIIYNLNIIND